MKELICGCTNLKPCADHPVKAQQGCHVCRDLNGGYGIGRSVAKCLKCGRDVCGQHASEGGMVCLVQYCGTVTRELLEMKRRRCVRDMENLQKEIDEIDREIAVIELREQTA